MEKKILGLDLGTNSIGWAVIKADVDEKGKEQLEGIEAAGSRIIPMDAALLGNFDKGNSVSQTSERTAFRGMRRLRERHLLRRERLHRVLDVLGFLPEHYANSLNRYGKFSANEECKLPWARQEDGTYEFLFQDSFHEMLADFAHRAPEVVAEGKKVPYDWTLYFCGKGFDPADSQGGIGMVAVAFQSKAGILPTSRRRGGKTVQAGRILCA